MSLSCPVCFGYSFRCISSSCGWLLFECESMCMKCTSFLYNPLMEKCIRLPRVLKHSCYVDCLYFSTRVDPIGVLFARKSNNTFLLYRLKYPCRSPKIIFSVLYGLKDLCCSPFHQYEWKETVVSNTIFCQGKLYTLNYQDWSLSVEDPLFPRKKITCLKIKLEVERKYPLFMREEPVCVLVESCEEILMVRVMGEHRFDVFWANLVGMVWEKVKNLGDRMLFLSSWVRRVHSPFLRLKIKEIASTTFPRALQFHMWNTNWMGTSRPLTRLDRAVALVVPGSSSGFVPLGEFFFTEESKFNSLWLCNCSFGFVIVLKKEWFMQTWS